MTLGTVLLVVAMVSAIVLSLAAVGVIHYQVTMSQFNRDAALDAARSAIRRAEAHLRTNAEWAEGFTEVCPGTRESSAVVTFSKSARAFSTNNLGSQTGVQGWGGQAVPPEFVHLVAVGTCRGQEQTVQAWLHAPAFPWAIASNGPVRLAGGAKVAGLSAVPEAGKAVSEDDLQPADLVCNGDSVYLGKGTEIFGDLLSSARLDVEAGANLTVGPVGPAVPDGVWVHGSVKSGEEAPEINQVLPSDFDPAAKGLPHSSLGQERYADSYHVSDSRRRQGDVRFDSGVVMEGGMLFVDGDLTVRGGLTGSGVVVCTGKMTVEGATALASGSGVAVVAGGEVALTGSGAERSYFQGLVYTDSGFSADRVSLVGPLISRGPGAVELTESRLLMPKKVPTEYAVGSADSPSQSVKISTGDNSGWSPVLNVTRLDAQESRIDMVGVLEGQSVVRSITVSSGDSMGKQKLAELLAPPHAAPVDRVRLISTSGLPELSIEDFFTYLMESKPEHAGGSRIELDLNRFFRLQDRLRRVLFTQQH